VCDSDRDVTKEYNTQSKWWKTSGRKKFDCKLCKYNSVNCTVYWFAGFFADSEDDDIMPGPSKKSIGEKDDDMDRVSIDTATLEAEFQVFENKITNEKPQKIHE
jgi:hypothetical protein